MTEIGKYWLDPFWIKIDTAVQEGQTEEFVTLIENAPNYFQSKGLFGGNWLIEAIVFDAKDIFEYMLRKGIDVNEEYGGKTGGETALTKSVQEGRVSMAKTLLERGADPNIGRILFNLCRIDQEVARQLFDLLLEHGIDLNRLFAMFGDAAHPLSALDYAGTGPFAEIFRKAGAKTAKEILAENPNTLIEGADAKP